jgi:hypothetical protein
MNEAMQATYLECVVKGNPIEQEIAKGLNDREECIYNPVNEPLLIIALHFRFNGLEGLVRRINEPCEATERSSSDTEKDDNGQESTQAHHNVFLLDLGHVLKEQKKGS